MKTTRHKQDRHSDFLYDGCMPEWWPALDAQAQTRQYKKGESIFKEGDRVQGVYFMIEGVVKVHKHWQENKDLIIRFASAQDILGHRGLSTQSSRYPVSATTLSVARLCFLEMPFFEATLKVNTRLLFDLMMFFADELQISERRMHELAHLPVRNRIAQALVDLEKKFGRNEAGFIGFPFSRQDIASYVGAAYETVYKVLMEFEQLGYIKMESKQLGILDLPQSIS